jgi:hypothetical protein
MNKKLRKELNCIKETDFPDRCWNKNCSFLVLMNRWGSAENHSYPLGIWLTLDGALHLANSEVQQSGGKYSAQIYVNKHRVADSNRRITLIYSINGKQINNLKDLKK